MKSLNEWKNEEMFNMLMERFIPEAKKYSSKEELAAMKPPKDEVTQADVLAARGVGQEEEDDSEIDIEDEE
jgi:hypothetical protein